MMSNNALTRFNLDLHCPQKLKIVDEQTAICVKKDFDKEFDAGFRPPRRSRVSLSDKNGSKRFPGESDDEQSDNNPIQNSKSSNHTYPTGDLSKSSSYEEETCDELLQRLLELEENCSYLDLVYEIDQISRTDKQGSALFEAQKKGHFKNQDLYRILARRVQNSLCAKNFVEKSVAERELISSSSDSLQDYNHQRSESQKKLRKKERKRAKQHVKNIRKATTIKDEGSRFSFHKEPSFKRQCDSFFTESFLDARMPWTDCWNDERNIIQFRSLNLGHQHGLDFYIKTKVSAPLLPLLTLIMELDQYYKWVPMMKSSTEIKTNTDPKKTRAVNLHIESPFPRLFSHRDLSMRLWPIDQLSHNLNVMKGSFLLYAESFRNDEALIQNRVQLNKDELPDRLTINTEREELPVEPKRTRRVDVKKLVILAEPAYDLNGEVFVNVSVEIQVDIFMFMPEWLLRNIVGSLLVKSIENLERYALAIDDVRNGKKSNWEHAEFFSKLLKQKDDYKLIEERAHQYLNRKKKKE